MPFAQVISVVALVGLLAFDLFILINKAPLGLLASIEAKERVQSHSLLPPRPGAILAPEDLFSWKTEMAKCAEPGPSVRRFLERFSGQPPERMARAYQFIAKHWRYRADNGRDWLSAARDLFRDADHVEADCKAIAVGLAACASALDIDAQMVVTEGVGTHPGHVQTRILLTGPNVDPSPMISRMLKIWGDSDTSVDEAMRNLPLVQINGRTWLVLDGGCPPRRVRNLGSIEAVLNNN